MTLKTNLNPAVRLRRKLARDAAIRARERYFARRILPLLLLWALFMAAVHVVAGGLISLGVVLTTYFSGAALWVLWLERRGRTAYRCRDCGSDAIGCQ